MTTSRIEGQIAIVTGASSGIGRATGLFSPSEARADLDVNLYVGAPIGFWQGWVPGGAPLDYLRRRRETCGPSRVQQGSSSQL